MGRRGVEGKVRRRFCTHAAIAHSGTCPECNWRPGVKLGGGEQTWGRCKTPEARNPILPGDSGSDINGSSFHTTLKNATVVAL